MISEDHDSRASTYAAIVAAEQVGGVRGKLGARDRVRLIVIAHL